MTDNVLSKVSTKEVSRAFFAKMAGDYYRYQSEVMNEKDAKKDVVNLAKDWYEHAMRVKLPPCSMLRLSIVLN